MTDSLPAQLVIRWEAGRPSEDQVVARRISRYAARLLGATFKRTDLVLPWCVTCDREPVRKCGRCATCYQFWRRTGRERPLGVIVANEERHRQRS